MMNRSQMKLINILFLVAWVVVAVLGLLLVVVAGRAAQLPLENAVRFATGLMPQVFLMLSGWILLFVGLAAGGWWYYRYFYGRTIFVRTPYGELEIHKAAIQGYLEQQLALMSEVENYEVCVAISKRRFLLLDIRVCLVHNKSCREYGEKLQQDILQMLLSIFAIKDVKHFHVEVDSFLGAESKKAINYR